MKQMESEVGVNVNPAYERQQAAPELSPRATAVFIALACLVGLTAAALAWYHTWDDAAITLGYSRTLAETGAIRFGRYGEHVEGFSAFLWMLVCALPATAFRSPDALLNSAKVLCAALYVLNAGLVYLLAAKCGLARRSALAVTLLYATAAVCVVSIPDAMENHLFLTLNLLAGLLYVGWLPGAGWLRGPVLIGLSATLIGLLLCRPEGVLTCGALCVGLWVDRARFDAQRRASILIALALTAVAFGAFLGWRHWYFGALMPNSVSAKMWPPYAKTFWLRVYTGGTASIKWAAAALIAFVGIWVRRGGLGAFLRSLKETGRRYAFFVAAIAAYLLYQLATGSYWGTLNRLLMPVTPFAWIVLVAAVVGAKLSLGRTRLAISAVLAIGAQAAFYAVYLQNPIVVGRIKQLVEPGVRLARLCATGVPKVAAADMGATILWWGQDVAFTDIALLNNREAARRGWGVMQQTIFGDGLPDLIEAHGNWQKLSGLDRCAAVHDNYALVCVDGRFYLLRNDHVARLRAAPPAGVSIRRTSELTSEEEHAIQDRVVVDFPARMAMVPTLPWEWIVALDSRGR